MIPRKFLVCPKCKRKGVYAAMRPHGEDMFRCRTRECGWHAFTVRPLDAMDLRALAALKLANPEEPQVADIDETMIDFQSEWEREQQAEEAAKAERES